MLIITPDFLKPYFKGTKKHNNYDETVKLYNGLRIHVDGEYPRELIEERRPHEDLTVKDYRKKIWAAVTEETVSRVINSLAKIRVSQDWLIKYNGKKSSAIADGEDLESYCEKDFPYTTSITNWMFSICLKQYLIDANAIVVMIPMNPVHESNEYVEPYPVIFNSSQVFDYVEGDYGIFYSKEKSTYSINSSTNTQTALKTDGKVYYTVDSTKIERWKQTDVVETMTLDWTYEHRLTEPPMFKLGGMFFEHKDTIFLYKSYINTMVPYLNEAVREYSDLQAEVVMHIHSESWEYAVEDCKQCQGIGKIQVADGWGACTSCKGRGKIDNSPYSKMYVRPANVGETPIPTPPKGYITKDVGIVKIQSERIEEHKYCALGAINMQFLAETPLNQSGKAKEVDRGELNNFVYSIAEDIVAIMDKVYCLCDDMRYMLVVPNEQAREDMLPFVNVPMRYDILDANVLMDEYLKAKAANVSPYLRSQLELGIVVQRFATSPEIKNIFIAINELDPLAGMATDEKTLALAQGAITKEDFVTSNYITPFVRRAVQENGDAFFSLKYEQKQAIIQKYADEKMTALSAAAKVKAQLSAAAAGAADPANNDTSL